HPDAAHRGGDADRALRLQEAGLRLRPPDLLDAFPVVPGAVAVGGVRAGDGRRLGPVALVAVARAPLRAHARKLQDQLVRHADPHVPAVHRLGLGLRLPDPGPAAGRPGHRALGPEACSDPSWSPTAARSPAGCSPPPGGWGWRPSRSIPKPMRASPTWPTPTGPYRSDRPPRGRAISCLRRSSPPPGPPGPRPSTRATASSPRTPTSPMRSPPPAWSGSARQAPPSAPWA